MLGENGGEGDVFREVRKEPEYIKVGDAHGEKRALRGCGAAMWLPQALAETPMGGGDRIRGLRLELLLMDEARVMSRVSPRGLWELRRGFGGLLASGELRLCCGGRWLKDVGDWTRELGSEAQNGRATRLCDAHGESRATSTKFTPRGLEHVLMLLLLLALAWAWPGVALWRCGWLAKV